MAVSNQKFRSIRFKFLFLVAVMLTGSTFVGTALIVFNEHNVLNHFLNDKGRSLGSYMANISKDPILLKDSIQLDAIVNEVNKDEDVVFAIIQDTDGTSLTTPIGSFNERMPRVKELIASLPKESGVKEIHDAIMKAGFAIELVQPVKIDSIDQGKVLVGLSDAQVRRQLLKTVFFVLAVNFFVTLLVGIVLFIASKRLILTPVSRLCAITDQIAKGDLSQTLEATANDELGHLTASLNTMIASLNQMVRQVNSATDEFNLITGNLSDAAGKVMEAARLQSEGVNVTSSAIIEINSSIKGVAGSVEGLSSSASESSSSILEMAASVEEVALNTETLAQSVGSVSSSIIQMATSIKQVSGSVSSLLDASNSTASSVMQMDLSIRQVEKNATQASLISEKVLLDAEAGRAAVASSMTSIEEIRESSAITYEVITMLSQRASEIGVILSVIDEVAEQTNLLALNAAIIAAQAGEHGKGFAVVAEEIKQLADRTTVSTREIAKVINGVQDETARAVSAIQIAEERIATGKALSEKSGDALQKICAGVENSTAQVREIASAILEQTRGSLLIRDAMEQVADMVEQIAKATNEQAQGSDVIMNSSEMMKQLTSQVRYAAKEQSKVGNFIAASTENITGMISQIRRACDEQTRGSDQISVSVEDIQSSAAFNLEATKMMNDSVTNLFKQIEVLKKEMSSFTL